MLAVNVAENKTRPSQKHNSSHDVTNAVATCDIKLFQIISAFVDVRLK